MLFWVMRWGSWFWVWVDDDKEDLRSWFLGWIDDEVAGVEYVVGVWGGGVGEFFLKV